MEINAYTFCVLIFLPKLCHDIFRYLPLSSGSFHFFPEESGRNPFLPVSSCFFYIIQKTFKIYQYYQNAIQGDLQIHIVHNIKNQFAEFIINNILLGKYYI